MAELRTRSSSYDPLGLSHERSSSWSYAWRPSWWWCRREAHTQTEADMHTAAHTTDEMDTHTADISTNITTLRGMGMENDWFAD